MRKLRSKLDLLSLENRLTPAVSVNFSGGTLTINGDNVSNSVFLSGQGSAMKVYVVEGADVFPAIRAAGGNPAAFETPANQRGPAAGFNVTKKIMVDMGNKDDMVLFTFNDGSTTKLSDKIDVHLGEGSDDVQMQTRNNAKATINAPVELEGKKGADNMFVFDLDLLKTLVVQGGGSGIRSDSGLPGDVVDISDVSVTGATTVEDTITLIDSGYGTNTLSTLNIVNDSVKDLGDFQLIDGTVFPENGGGPGPGHYSGLLVLDTGSKVTGTVVYQGSNSVDGHDGIYVYGTIGKSLTATMKEGGSELYIGDFAGPGNHVPEAGTINGGVVFKSTKGVDHLRIAAGSLIQNGASFNMSGGDNLYDLAQAWTLTGTLNIQAGNGFDNVGTVGGSVGGSETYNLGGGKNTLRLAGTFTGTKTTYQGGSGVDSVTLASIRKAFTGNFGDRNDVFRYEAGSKLTSFVGDGQGGTDTYDKSQVAVTWPETIKNFEIIIP